jgi:hypothetical protein
VGDLLRSAGESLRLDVRRTGDVDGTRADRAVGEVRQTLRIGGIGARVELDRVMLFGQRAREDRPKKLSAPVRRIGPDIEAAYAIPALTVPISISSQNCHPVVPTAATR